METRKGSYNVDLIRDDMALKGWLATDLAREAGVSDMTITRFLTADTQTAPTAKKIAVALGRSVKRYYIPREAVAS
jgi:transcriptional regulator with XRE-family HTH domain